MSLLRELQKKKTTSIPEDSEWNEEEEAKFEPKGESEKAVSWSGFFDKREIIEFEDGRFFCTYQTKSVGNEMAKKVPLIVFHHGAGLCALSFALLALNLSKGGNYNILAYDCRGHGISLE